MEIYENLFQGSNDEPANETPKFKPFVPHNDLVLVTPFQEDNSKAGSFIVPEKFRQKSNQGIVVAIGPWVCDGNIGAGDKITFGIGNSETVMIDGVEHQLIRENDIRGIERVI